MTLIAVCGAFAMRHQGLDKLGHRRATLGDVALRDGMRSAGTMIKLLWESGLKVHGTMSRAAAKRLNRHEGYAGYSYLNGQAAGLYYWFVQRDGRISTVTQSVDYPISPEERAAFLPTKRGRKL